MKAQTFLAFFVAFSATLVACEDDTRLMLDAMEQLMTSGPQFDRTFLNKLYQCWDKIDPNLKTSQDNAWKGMVEYFDSNGSPGDEWGSCQGQGHCAIYWEQNATAQNYHNLIIYEPCNYASNAAYYHVTTQICDHWENWNVPADYKLALGQVFSSLAFGSAFWHGSHTYAGNVADNRIIEVLSYVAHQSYLEKLGDLVADKPVLTDLAMSKRPQTGLEINADLTDLFANRPASEWADAINAFDMPSYYTTFGAIVGTVFTVALPNEQADQLIDALIELFNFPADEAVFFKDFYLPEIRAVVAQIDISSEVQEQTKLNFESALIKLLYAFIWQEWAIGDSPAIYDPEVNEAGADLIPAINAFANSLNNFPIYDQDLQNGVKSYPGGDEWCNDYSPHAKWHLQAANGLMDLIYLTDDLYNILELPTGVWDTDGQVQH